MHTLNRMSISPVPFSYTHGEHEAKRMKRRNDGCLRKPLYKKRGAFILAIAICLVLAGSIVHADSASKKHILVLNSYHKGLSWTDRIVEGIESALRTESGNFELYLEFMDTKRYVNEDHMRSLYDLYRIKFKEKTFDVVIATDNNAFDFLRRYHEELFPDTPVVFCGINNYKDALLEGFALFTGVVEDIDIKDTVEIALELHPDATRIVVVGDKTTSGIAIRQQVAEIAPLFEDRVDFVFYTDDFALEELKTEIRRLSSDSIILLTVVTRDRTGNFFPYEEGLAIVYRESAVPIYSFYDAYLSRGIVGGMLTNGFQQGRSAGLMALRILEGEAVSAIPVMKESPNRYMFDYEQLRRFGIKTSNLPSDSIIINQPETFYSRHKTVILISIATVTALILIISVLLGYLVYRRRMEKALRESEERYRDLYENAPDMCHSVNRDGMVIYCNDTEARMLGYEKEEIIGKPITNFFTEKSKEIYAKEFPTLKDKKVHLGLEREFVRKDGSVLTTSLNIFTETDERGELKLTRTIARDITERKRLQELKESQEQLRSYSTHLENIREEEKKRIAREIHDQLGHALTTLSLDLSWICKRLPDDIRTLVERTQAMSSLIESTIESVQRISAELVPGVLDHLGLVEAIKWQAEEFRKRTKLEFEISTNPETIKLDYDKALAVFRVFQEALTNIVRHAEARRVEVSVTAANSRLSLEVKDDGIGITENQIAHPGSIGIVGMKERVLHLGGEISFNSAPNKGTIVSLHIPL